MIKPNRQGTSRHMINQLLLSSIDCRVQRFKIKYLVFEGIIELTKQLHCSTLQYEVTRLTIYEDYPVYPGYERLPGWISNNFKLLG